MAEIEIHGMRELRRDLEEIEGALIELRAAHRRVAEAAADFIRPKLPVGTKPTSKKPGRLRDTLKATASTRYAGINWGRKAVPYAPIVEFGGYPKPGLSGGPGRPFVKEGRYIYPALDDFRPRAVTMHADEIERLVKKFNNKKGG